MTRTVRKPKLARSQKTYNANQAKVAHAMFGVNERVFEIDSKGRKVRVFSRDHACTHQDVMELVVGVRAFSEAEALEVVGKNVFGYALSKGYIRKGKDGYLFWITKTGAAAWGLERPVLADGSHAKFVD